MADYVLVVDLEENWVDINARVDKNFDNYRKITDNAWVIRSTSTTSQGISETLFGTKQSADLTERHAVFRFTAFWGFHSRVLWEWIDSPKSDG